MKTVIKNALKKTLTAYPMLKRNRLWHEASSIRDRVTARPDPTRSSRPDLVEALMRDGVVSVEGFIDGTIVAKMRDELEPHFEDARAGKLPGTHRGTKAEDAVYYRLTDVDKLVDTTRAFYHSPVVLDVVQAYMPRAESFRREAELRCNMRQEVSAEDLWHFDTWHPNVKAFLYLTDVDAESAPFRYLVGSHRPASWRRKREMEFDADGWDGSFGHFFPGEVAAVQRKHGLVERVFTAKAGTLILGDFRGLHKGTPLRQQGRRRIMLNQVFNILDWAF